MATVTTNDRPGRPRRPAATPSVPSKAAAPIAPSPPPASTYIEPERRRAMISEAAYYLAERRGFCPGGEFEDWLAAESEIDQALSASQTKSRYEG